MTDKFEFFITPEFIRDYEKSTGIRIIPDIFPWKFLGVTDKVFFKAKIKFTDGTPIPEPHQIKLLGLVRKLEKDLLEYRDYMAKREKRMGKKTNQTQLELF